MGASLEIGNGNWAIDEARLLAYRQTDKGKFTPKEGDFERLSIGSYVDRDGILQTGVKTVYGRDLVSNGQFADPVIGPELVTNRNFNADTDWTLTTGVTISGGLLNFATGVSSSAKQSISLTEGQYYEVTFEITAFTSGAIRVRIGDNTSTLLRSEVGTFTEVLLLGDIGTSEISIESLGGANLSVDNVTVKETNSSWLFTDVNVNIANNLLNFDVVDQGENAYQVLSLPSTESFRITYTIQDYVSGGIQVYAGGQLLTERTANGTYTDEIVSTNGNGVFYVQASQNGTELAMNMISVERKDEVFDNFNKPRIDFSEDQNGVLLLEPQSTNLYLNNETLVTQNVTTSASEYTVSFYGSGTITFSGSYTGSLVGVDDNTLVELTFTASAGTLTSTVTGTVSYGQCELGNYASSRIITQGSTATRLQDEATNFGTVNDFNSEEGVIVFNAKYLTNEAGSKKISISDGTDSNRIYITPYQTTDNTIRIIITSNGSKQADLSYPLDLTEEHEYILVYGNGQATLYVDEVQRAQDLSVTMPPANTFDNLRFGDENPGVNNFFEGKVIYLKYYKSIAEARKDYPFIS